MKGRIGKGLLAGWLVALLVAAPAAAGGWASVLDDEALPPDDGGATVVRFRLLQHGTTPVDWGELGVVAVNEESGERVDGTAAPQSGEPGAWTATFRLPSAGTWRVEIRHEELEVITSHPIRVTSAAPASASTTGATAGVASWLGVTLLGLAVLLPAGAAFALARRRRPRRTGKPQPRAVTLS